MANIAIIDTGYLNTSQSSGTKATQVNSGTAINMKSVTMNYENALNVDTSPLINGLSPNIISLGSTSNAKITLTGVLDKNDSTDMTNLTLLRDMTRTYGIKLIYYTNTTDGVRDITDTMGVTTVNGVTCHTTEIGSSIPHFHVFVTGFQVRDASDSHMRFTMEFVEVGD